ncbi:hypothetical protein SCUP234_11935 [Seiridium cupressi]
MRPSGLILAIATPVLCAIQPRSVAQLPVLVDTHDVATSSYPQEPAINGTIAAMAKSSTVEMVVDSSSPPSTAADIPTPALDKSIFSLIVFGIAGLCLI